ncbi:anaphase-promoting complex subunit 1-like [Octopus sinensis]|uniref:Anaphase-promoting complex subunit 1-like n=1 Tax=Octopus sinensis TaxID=2607531 RepID=A0A6P7TE78_9MOLL|nr:anaphase-promoting complex subunit 1-like [Octopus sinensis]
MIAACETQDFVPFGREYIHLHPGKFEIQVQRSHHADHGLPLLRSFRDISISEQSPKEQWYLHCKPDSNCVGAVEEELYVSGNTVVWSVGTRQESRRVLKTFTVESPVIQAMYCSFLLSYNTEIPEQIDLDIPGELQEGICVLESTTASVFTSQGEEYNVALPFQVTKSWVIKNGLLFERSLSSSEIVPKVSRNAANHSIVFSMLHPLNDIAPVIHGPSNANTTQNKVSYFTDTSQSIVFSCVEPSILLVYDNTAGLHCVWKVRRVKPEESNFLFETCDMPSLCHLNNSLLNTSSHNQSKVSNISPGISLLQNFSNRTFSPSPSCSISPVVSNHLTSSGNSGSCTQSPLAFASSSQSRPFYSLNAQSRSSMTYMRSPPGSQNFSVMSESMNYRIEPVNPDICLDHIWTESATSNREEFVGKASKAFIAKDLCEQNYLCYLIPQRQHLRCVKFEKSNDNSQLIFGAVCTIAAKDALPVELLNLTVVLDLSGSLIIYSGTTKINKLFVPKLPIGIASLNASASLTPHNSVRVTSMITSSRPSSTSNVSFEDQLSHISPVIGSPNVHDNHVLESSTRDSEICCHDNTVHCIRDNTLSRFTIETTDGSLLRTSLPPLTESTGIESSLEALRYILPKDCAMKMLSRWYTTRNVTSGFDNQSEWVVFSRFLLGQMGFDTSRLPLTHENEFNNTTSPVVEVKRAKPSNQGCNDDWEYLLKSEHHHFTSKYFDSALGFSLVAIPNIYYPKPCTVNPSAPLFSYIPSILFSLHLVYEELKLNTCLSGQLEYLALMLFFLANNLKCFYYTDIYCRDFPHLYNMVDENHQIHPEQWAKLQFSSIFTEVPPNICMWISKLLSGLECQPVPFLPNICKRIENIVILYTTLVNQNCEVTHFLREIPVSGYRTLSSRAKGSLSETEKNSLSIAESIVLLMTRLGITKRDLESYPIGVVLPLREAILQCRWDPPSDWPEEAYILIGRKDLSRISAYCKCQSGSSLNEGRYVKECPSLGKTNKEDDDGMGHLDEELLKLRFSEDLRVQEVRHMLQSSRPVRISLQQKPEVSDHEFIEEQERYLYAICTRTMALPVGRGMFTLSSFHPLPTEALPIPKLCLTGKAPPRNTTVDLSHIETPSNMATWPHFHNGVAAGLRIANSSQINSTWINYNRPKTCDFTTEYAGFLMALGLNGHLAHLATLNIHEYLSKGQDMTTIGVLLGLAATKRGTMDQGITKVLSIHVPALLPPTSTELNISHNVQVAAVLGVGLVYQGTSHRHIAEVLLSEIGRPPGPEMENCTNRESYATAAGLALGLVMFGKGSEAAGLSDLGMADTLCHFMIGGHKRPVTGPNRERYRSPSYQIKEGDSVNVDVTSSGATLALGMLYFNTNNTAVADWLKAPDTQFTLDHVRPDFLMLRTLCHGLVLWDHVLPTTTWIDSNLPIIVQKYGFKRESHSRDEDNIDYETMSQAYCNIVGGACMAMGLKFAGTANAVAYQTLLDCMKRCMYLLPVPPFCEQAGKSTVENCTVVVLLSLAMVMAGTGDLDVLRIARALRKRVGPQHSYATYGSHMAVSMAIGLLFLGGGRYSLSTKPEAIAAMLCAFFPKFPTHSIDNRYHLQAFRHLYVLAAEPRVLIPENVISRQPCYVPVEIRFNDTKFYKNVCYTTMAPCLIPELNLLKEVKILGPRYWPIRFDVDKNWKTLELLLKNSGVVYVKQKAGHLSYSEDPKGYHGHLAKSLTNNESSFESTKLHPKSIKSFTSDARILAFSEFFLFKNEKECDRLAPVVYSCAFKEKPEGIPTQMNLAYEVWQSQINKAPLGLWQLKIVLNYYGSKYQFKASEETEKVPLVELDYVLSLKNELEKFLADWESNNMEILLKYFQGESLKDEQCGHLSAFIVWYDIPHPHDLASISVKGKPTLPVLCSQLPHLPMSSIMKLLNAWCIKQTYSEKGHLPEFSLSADS